jgi:nucleoid-associated protein YgaU
VTARGRRLLVVLMLAGVVAIAAAAGTLLDGGAGGLHLAGKGSVVVESGDTLWSIAASVADGDDVRDVVAQMRALNGLDSADLVPGQVLQLP